MPFAAEPVGLESDHLVFAAALEHDVLPCVHRPLASGVGRDRAVQQFTNSLFVELSIGSMQCSVARNHHF